MLDKKDFLSGFFFLVLGLFLAIHSMRLSVWDNFMPQEGFFPFVVAIIIIGLSLIIIRPFILIRTKGEKNKIGGQEKKEVSVFRVSSYAILILVYGILMETVGFLITSAIFLILILKYVECQSWKITILLGSSSIIIGYLLFVYFLRVPLPRGLIKWL